MVVYIILLCLTFIAGSVSAGLAVSYKSKFSQEVENATKSAYEDAGIDESSKAVLDLITNAFAVYSGEDISSGNTTVTLTDEAKAYRSARRTSTTAAIILYVIFALSIAGTITSVQYDKYLKSEKYKAKLKRMKKYENSYNTGM